jgi:hypothetical protein
VRDAVEAGRVEELLAWEQRAPEARRMSLAGSVRNRIFEYGSLSMAAFVWS